MKTEEIMNLREAQKAIYQNKVDKGFNTSDVNKEFCLLYGEVAEAYDAWRKKKENVGEELADVAIYLLGLSRNIGSGSGRRNREEDAHQSKSSVSRCERRFA
jgi:NTP pyrophosphatase (non-canonical NTP hydrolase)